MPGDSRYYTAVVNDNADPDQLGRLMLEIPGLLDDPSDEGDAIWPDWIEPRLGGGASPEGDRPFFDLLDLDSLETERLWRNSGEEYETVVDVLAVEDGGFTLLTLVLSIQAAYAAPLILLAQARQERRDRVAAEVDREVAERTQSDTEFLARELASVRLSLSDVVTGEEFGERLDLLTDAVERLGRQVDSLAIDRATDAPRAPVTEPN